MSDTGDEIRLRYLRALAALDRKELDLARREFELLALDFPRFAPAWDGLGRCFQVASDLQRAGECYREAMRLDRQNWRSPFNWGLALLECGDLRQAHKWLRRAARLAPSDRSVHFALGRSLVELGKLRAAQRCFEAALAMPEKDCGDTELLIALGNTLRDLKKGEEAETCFQRACLISPNDGRVYLHWARLTSEREGLEAGLALARRAGALLPHDPVVAGLAAELALQAGQFPELEQAITELEHRGPTRLSASLRARAALLQEDVDAARRHALLTVQVSDEPFDGPLDRALFVLMQLHGEAVGVRDYRIVIRVIDGDRHYYRPYLVAATSVESARGWIEEIQPLLDPLPWEILEADPLTRGRKALQGVQHLTLNRVWFSNDQW